VIAIEVVKHADHGSNALGIAGVILTALVVVAGFIVYAIRPPRDRK